MYVLKIAGRIERLGGITKDIELNHAECIELKVESRK
jgi:hypothetical protein